MDLNTMELIILSFLKSDAKIDFLIYMKSYVAKIY